MTFRSKLARCVAVLDPRWALLPLLALSFAACSSSGEPSSGTVDAGSGGKGGSSGVGGAGGSSGAGAAGGSSGAGGSAGAAACPAGTHVTDTGSCEATLDGWTDGPALAQARDHHLTFVAPTATGARLYVAGGAIDAMTPISSVEFAPIAKDGSVGAWQAGKDLPDTMMGASIAIVGSTIVVSGGYRTTGGLNISKKTETNQVQPDGSLGDWVEGPELSAIRFHHAMAAWKDSVYVVGGITGNGTTETDVVERAVVTDGTLGAWSPVTALPHPWSHHSVVAYQGALYVTGGLNGNPALATSYLVDVIRAPIHDDGTLGDWVKIGELPQALATHASFTLGDDLFVVGGVHSNLYDSKDVLRATLSDDGMLGTWEMLPALPKARKHVHQTPLFNGFVYSVAGAAGATSIADVFVGKLH